MHHFFAAQTSALEPVQEYSEDLIHRVQEGDFVVGWGTLALINAGLAQGKNRSGLGWFLLSLLLGPFATFFLVVFCDKLEYED